jgi:hypothetical protein
MADSRRRTIFSTRKEESTTISNSTVPVRDELEKNQNDLPPRTVLSQLRVSEKKQRRRQWEQQHRSGQISFRAFPIVVSEQIKTMSAELNLPVDVIASKCLTFGLAGYAEKRLRLQPVLQGRRWTLFATEFGI